MSELTPELLLQGYGHGIFPMAEHRDDPEIFWVDPERRGILPLDGFHISRSLAKAMRRTTCEIRVDTNFDAVVAACADRADTWINDEIFSLYSALHLRGHAHSCELWENETLVGGVYGVTLGAAFFGESMFSRRTNGSKMALAALVDRLNRAGYRLFDTQFITAHLASLGAVEIDRSLYHAQLQDAISRQAHFNSVETLQPYDVVQRMIQTS
ncbi:leucyl/phenylalanyl-tRNA--protein transferase [Sulfitobacter sp. F26204]|uniref:leucyl/phenylalanyl-tRNA--protein transferase n=1 Tax=Sulfitobacter sp. F26204 TaxID=2996014 RepID=UPI00225DD3D9|nr:leucyl/phenylalanyl-tRNA--protein transferase [Sulfitobacter sp. F26204]MCX7560116.1 leucyl/phenylalanyl-tRNA--protein transferase [Sulfitobacter sp. F26204]